MEFKMSMLLEATSAQRVPMARSSSQLAVPRAELKADQRPTRTEPVSRTLPETAALFNEVIGNEKRKL